MGIKPDKHVADFVSRKEFVKLMAKACGDSQQVCNRNFNAFCAVLGHIINDGKDFRIPSIGAVTYRMTAPRMQYNPMTECTHYVPSHKKLMLKPTGLLRKQVKQKSIDEKDVDSFC